MKTTIKGIFLFILLIPSVAQAYTEAFYVEHGGSGNGLSAGSPAGESWFENGSNWDTDVSADSKIGPDDVVYFLDTGGAYTSTWTAAGSGILAFR